MKKKIETEKKVRDFQARKIPLRCYYATFLFNKEVNDEWKAVRLTNSQCWIMGPQTLIQKS